MTVYAWPGWGASRFNMKLLANLRTFTGPYTPNVQVLDFMGERWMGSVTLTPTTDPIEAAAREAFFDRLKGQAHQIALYHLKLTAPQGTLRDGAAVNLVNTAGQPLNLVNSSGQPLTLISGTPCLRYAVAQGANTAVLSAAPGVTVRAGDLLGIYGQVVRVMADATANGSGALSFEFQGRARSAWPAGTAVVWDKPTFNAMLKTTDTPTTEWVPGYAEGLSFDFIEAL